MSDKPRPYVPTYTPQELVELIKNPDFLTKIKKSCLILVTDAGSDCDDIMALDVLLAHGVIPSLIITTMYHPCEKLFQMVLHLRSRGYSIPVVPGEGYEEDKSGSEDDFMSEHAWWPKEIFQLPMDKGSVISQHNKNYAELFGYEPGIVEEVTQYVHDKISGYSSKTGEHYWLEVTKTYIDEAKKENNPIFFLGLAPLKCEAKIVEKGLLDGCNEVYALIMNGGFLKRKANTGAEGLPPLDRVGYNYIMDPKAADYFLWNFPGIIIVITSDLWKENKAYLPKEKLEELLVILSNTDIGRCYAADIKMFQEGKHRSGPLPLADCYVGYFASHPAEVKSVYAVEFHGTKQKYPKAGQNMFHIDNPEDVAILRSLEKSNIFLINEIENPTGVNETIVDDILAAARKLENIFQVNKGLGQRILSHFRRAAKSLVRETQSIEHTGRTLE